LKYLTDKQCVSRAIMKPPPLGKKQKNMNIQQFREKIIEGNYCAISGLGRDLVLELPIEKPRELEGKVRTLTRQGFIRQGYNQALKDAIKKIKEL